MADAPVYLIHVECDCARTDGTGVYMHKIVETDLPDRETFFALENKCPDCGAIYRPGDHD